MTKSKGAKTRLATKLAAKQRRVTRKPPKHWHSLNPPFLSKLPLEIRWQIYRCLFPEPQQQIDVGSPEPPLKLCIEIGKLMRTCSQIGMEIEELWEEERYQRLEMSKRYGLVDLSSTTFFHMVTRKYRAQRTDGFNWAGDGRLAAMGPQPWCNWSWIALRTKAIHYAINLATEDTWRRSSSHQNCEGCRFGTGDNYHSLKYLSGFTNLQTLKIFITWSGGINVKSWNRHWDKPPDNGVNIPGMRGNYISIWENGGKRPEVMLFLVGEDEKKCLLKRWPSIQETPLSQETTAGT